MIIPKELFNDFCAFWSHYFGKLVVRENPRGGEWARTVYKGRLLQVKEQEYGNEVDTLEVFCPERSYLEDIEKLWAEYLHVKINSLDGGFDVREPTDTDEV